MPLVKIQTFPTRADQDAKRWDLLESDETKEEDVMMIENDCIWKVRCVYLVKEGMRNGNHFY